MSDTTKPLSERDANQVLQHVHNNVNSTLGVDGFIVGKVGRKITRTAVSGTIEDYEFFEGTTSLYKIRVTYDNSSHDNVDQVERTA